MRVLKYKKETKRMTYCYQTLKKKLFLLLAASQYLLYCTSVYHNCPILWIKCQINSSDNCPAYQWGGGGMAGFSLLGHVRRAYTPSCTVSCKYTNACTEQYKLSLPEYSFRRFLPKTEQKKWGFPRGGPNRQFHIVFDKFAQSTGYFANLSDSACF